MGSQDAIPLNFSFNSQPKAYSTSLEVRPMALTLDCVSVADGRQPTGFASFTGHSPDGSRRSANKMSAIWKYAYG